MNRVTTGVRILCGAFILWIGLFPSGAFAQQYQFNASLSANDSQGISPGDQVTLTRTVTNAGPISGTGSAQVAIPAVFQYNGQAGCSNSTVAGPDGDTFYFNWNSIPDNTDL